MFKLSELLLIISVQSLSRVWLFVTPWITAPRASLSITNSQSLLKLMSIESVMPSNNLILCCPLLLLPSIFPRVRIFSNESALCIRWPNYWNFSFSICPSNGYSGLISFRVDWFDLLAVQGTLKSLLQHHTSKASIFRCSAFFMVHLSHPWETSLVAQMVKRLPTMRETRVQSLGWEDSLEKAMASHSSTLAWKIPCMEEHCWLQSMGLQKSWTQLSD